MVTGVRAVTTMTILLTQNIVKALTNSIVTCRRAISVTSRNMERALENLQNNPFYEKYSDRISELQKTSPEEFKARVLNRQTTKEIDKKAPVDTRQYSSALNPKESRDCGSSAEEKKLSKIFKVDLVKDKEGAEIKVIWEEYHKQLEVISASIPAAAYSAMHERMKHFPTFVFPLPRAHGYEFVLSQCLAHSVHFTPLLAYQIHKENAPECLTMVHYPELSHKGIVLMRGDYDKNVLTGQEAQCLANQFQMYYNGKQQDKLQLLETFTKNPQNFKHMDLISHLENIELI